MMGMNLPGCGSCVVDPVTLIPVCGGEESEKQRRVADLHYVHVHDELQKSTRSNWAKLAVGLGEMRA